MDRSHSTSQSSPTSDAGEDWVIISDEEGRTSNEKEARHHGQQQEELKKKPSSTHPMAVPPLALALGQQKAPSEYSDDDHEEGKGMDNREVSCFDDEEFFESDGYFRTVLLSARTPRNPTEASMMADPLGNRREVKKESVSASTSDVGGTHTRSVTPSSPQDDASHHTSPQDSPRMPSRGLSALETFLQFASEVDLTGLQPIPLSPSKPRNSSAAESKEASDTLDDTAVPEQRVDAKTSAAAPNVAKVDDDAAMRLSTVHAALAVCFAYFVMKTTANDTAAIGVLGSMVAGAVGMRGLLRLAFPLQTTPETTWPLPGPETFPSSSYGQYSAASVGVAAEVTAFATGAPMPNPLLCTKAEEVTDLPSSFHLLSAMKNQGSLPPEQDNAISAVLSIGKECYRIPPLLRLGITMVTCSFIAFPVTQAISLTLILRSSVVFLALRSMAKLIASHKICRQLTVGDKLSS